MYKMKKNNLKLTLLGDTMTGKSTISHRLVYNKFVNILDSTIGANFMYIKIDNTTYEIWDVCGQTRYLSLMQIYYRNTDIFLMIFDVTNLSTIDRLRYHIDKIKDEAITEYRIILIGNKIDLINDNQMDNIKNTIKQKIQSDNIYDCIYISTKTGINFNNIIEKIIILGKELINKKNLIESENVIIDIPQNKIENKTKYCYC